MHAADIANSCLPFDQALQWAQRITLEFHNQGKTEKALGFTPAPFMETSPDDLEALYKLQTGFIKFIVEPYWEPLGKLFPALKEQSAVLQYNLALYEAGPTDANDEKSQVKELRVGLKQ